MVQHQSWDHVAGVYIWECHLSWAVFRPEYAETQGDDNPGAGAWTTEVLEGGSKVQRGLYYDLLRPRFGI